MTGFVAGLIVSMFSKILVPLIGLGIVLTQVMKLAMMLEVHHIH